MSLAASRSSYPLPKGSLARPCSRSRCARTRTALHGNGLLPVRGLIRHKRPQPAAAERASPN
jgi:hypothetical protein